MTVGYDADRLRSVLDAQREAQRYCWDYENRKKMFVLTESTIYQGKFDQQVTETAKIAGRVGRIMGKPEVAKAGKVLSSWTDYKTTLEFQCQ